LNQPFITLVFYDTGILETTYLQSIDLKKDTALLTALLVELFCIIEPRLRTASHKIISVAHDYARLFYFKLKILWRSIEFAKT